MPESKSCTVEEHCVNCSGDHSANSRKCPHWVHEKRVQEYMVENKKNYLEARQILFRNKSGPTYANVAANAETPSLLPDLSALLPKLVSDLLPKLITDLLPQSVPALVPTILASLQPEVDAFFAKAAESLRPPSSVAPVSGPPAGCSHGPLTHSACR